MACRCRWFVTHRELLQPVSGERSRLRDGVLLAALSTNNILRRVSSALRAGLLCVSTRLLYVSTRVLAVVQVGLLLTAGRTLSLFLKRDDDQGWQHLADRAAQEGAVRREAGAAGDSQGLAEGLVWYVEMSGATQVIAVQMGGAGRLAELPVRSTCTCACTWARACTCTWARARSCTWARACTCTCTCDSPRVNYSTHAATYVVDPSL